MSLGSGTTIGVVKQGQENTDTGKQLLDVAELNAGSSFTVQAGTPGLPGNPVKLLDLRADSKNGKVVTVTFSQQFVTAPLNGNAPSQPVVGIIEFGNGSAFSTVEVDIPPPDLLSAIFPAYAPYVFQKSGVCLSVPAGSLRVYARNDSSQILAGIRSGPNGPVQLGTTQGVQGQDPTVYAHVSYLSTFGAVPPTRTLYLISPGGFALGIGEIIVFDIPPFATSYRLYSSSVTTPTVSSQMNVQISFINGIYTYNYVQPVGSDGFQSLPGGASTIGVTNTSGALINSLLAVFDIGNF